jgi:ABC-type nitrate/sulfonate/bicarbonate transport system substrate-binding protein
MKLTKIPMLAAALFLSLAVASCSSPAATDAPPTTEASTATEAESTEASACGPLGELTTMTVAVNPGAQDLVTQTIREQELDIKYNLNLVIKSFLNPPASATAITQKAVDVGFGGVTSMAKARSQGSDVFLFGALASPSNGVFVPMDSSIENIGDLEGKRLGSFGGTNSATFSILSVIASKAFGMDKLEDSVASLAVAPDAAVLGLMDNGDLDAVLLGSTATIVTQLTGQYKQIGALSSEYLDITGVVPVHLALTSTDSYAEDHCSELVAFSNAIREGIEFVQGSDEAWVSYAEALKLTDPKAPATLQAETGGNFRSAWDQEQVDGISAMLEAMIPILGADKFIAEVPDGLFRLEYRAQD